MKRYLAFLFCLTTSVAACGQVKKASVYFHCNCEDSTGASLATALRDRLALSPRFQETSDSTGMSFQIHMVTMDPSDNNNGYSTIYSVVITFGPTFYVTHTVGVCGARNLDTCSSQVLSGLDSATHPD